MISESHTVPNTLRGVAVATGQEESVAGTVNSILAFTSILTSTNLHTWQEDACIAYFKAKIRYTALCKYLMHGDDNVTPASSMFFETRTTYIRRRQDLLTVGVPQKVINRLDKLHLKLMKTIAPQAISMNPLEDSF